MDASALCSYCNRLLSSILHTSSRNTHEGKISDSLRKSTSAKTQQLEEANRLKHERVAHQVREESVKVREMGMRSACYHYLRKVYAPGGVHKRRREAVQAMQEHHEPVPIHIRIDTQEQRSGIPDLLAAMPQGARRANPSTYGRLRCRRASMPHL